jgi:orotidine-5'-phosphate decarboxylase
MPHAADDLIASSGKTRSIACVGLDPRPALIPRSLIDDAKRQASGARAVAAAFIAFNRGLLQAIAGHCAAVKPQAACYEAYGSAGFAALEETVRIAHELKIPVIVDGKRNDIGSTAEHYQQAFLGSAPDLDGAPVAAMKASWLTINAYLGSDGVKPFLAAAPDGSGIFVLVKTSNPSSGEFQDLPLQEGTAMEAMARLVAKWGVNRVGSSGFTDVGAVVGATYPDQARRLRELMPHTIFLVPGYGTQGGTARDARAGARADGSGVIVNSSRAIIGAWQNRPGGESAWAECAREALDAMNRDLGEARL